MAQERSALGEFEIRGEWWLPENPGKRAAGVLRYRAGDRVKLQLDKAIAEHWVSTGKIVTPFSAEPVEAFSPEPVRLDIVLGDGRDGSKITLADAFSFGFGGDISASFLLVGRHFETVDAITFASANLNLTELEVWSGHSPTGSPFLPTFTSQPHDTPFRVDLPYRRKKLLDFESPSRACGSKSTRG
jgi:hypothetical protein